MHRKTSPREGCTDAWSLYVRAFTLPSGILAIRGPRDSRAVFVTERRAVKEGTCVRSSEANNMYSGISLRVPGLQL